MKPISITARARAISASTIKACIEFASEFSADANETRAVRSKLSPNPRFAISAKKILTKLRGFARKPKSESMPEISDEASYDLISIVEMLGEKLCAIEEQIECLRADVQNLAFMHNANALDPEQIKAARQLQAELKPIGLSRFSNSIVTAVISDTKVSDSYEARGKVAGPS